MRLVRREFIRLGAVAALGEALATVPATADELKTVRVLSVPSDGAKGILYAQKWRQSGPG